MTISRYRLSYKLEPPLAANIICRAVNNRIPIAGKYKIELLRRFHRFMASIIKLIY